MSRGTAARAEPTGKPHRSRPLVRAGPAPAARFRSGGRGFRGSVHVGERMKPVGGMVGPGYDEAIGRRLSRLIFEREAVVMIL